MPLTGDSRKASNRVGKQINFKTMKKKFMNFLEKLSHDEMRTITGGYGTGNCGWSGGSGWDGGCDYDQATAMDFQATWGGYWCCESCGSTSYCG